MNPNSSPATSSPLTPSVALAPYGYAFFVQESPSTPKEEWVRNGMIFATESEAKQYGCDLISRWFGICGGEVRPVDLHPTYKWVDGRAERLLLPAEQPEGTGVGPEGTGVGQDAVSAVEPVEPLEPADPLEVVADNSCACGADEDNPCVCDPFEHPSEGGCEGGDV